MSIRVGSVFAGVFYVIFGLIWIAMTSSMSVGPGAMFSVPIDIHVADLHTALAQITAAVAQSNSSIVGVSMSEEDEPEKLVRLTILVRDKGHLMHVMRTIGQCPVVMKVKRVLEAGLPPKKKKG